jgi:uncharacterized protein HemX
MNWLLLLAQDAPDAEKTVGTIERVIAGGVPLICLVVAVAAVVAAVLQYKKNADLETKYREDLENRAKVTVSDAEKRLTDAKNDAKERAVEVDRLMRERLTAEKESDATLAQAVRIIEANTKLMERIERKLGS